MAVSENRNDYICNKCSHRHCDKSNPAGYPKWVIPGIIETDVCLLPLISENTENLLKIYRHYNNNVMPFSGGFMEQSNYVIEAMNIIEKAIQE